MVSWDDARDLGKRAVGWTIKGASLLTFYPSIYFRYLKGERGRALWNPFSKEAGLVHLPPGPERPRRFSPHYALDSLENPRDASTPIPKVYGKWRVVPIALQQSVEPGLLGAGNGIPASRDQVVQALFAVAEGPVASVSDIRINGTPILAEPRKDVSLGKGTGSKKAFDLPDRWVYLPSVEVKKAGTKVTLLTKTETLYPTLPATGNKLEPFTRSDRRERILEDTFRVYVGADEQLRTGSSYPWGLRKVSPRKVILTFQKRPPTNKQLKVTYDYLGTDGCAVQQDEKGFSQVVFSTAPGNGQDIAATYQRMNFPRLRFDVRLGTLDQSPIDGFTTVKNSVAPDSTNAPILLAQNPGTLPTHKTDPKLVDDLVLVFSAPFGFIAYNDEGEQRSVQSRITVDYRKKGATQWINLRHRGGSEFKLAGMTTSKRTWYLPIRRTIQERADAGELDAVDELEAFDRAAYEVRVNRLDKVQQDTNSSVIDRIYWNFVTHVVETPATSPGTVLLGIRYTASEALHGSFPLVSAVVDKGPLHDPRTDPGDGSIEKGSGENLGLQLLDYLTSGRGKWKERYGGGHWWSESDFDTTSTARGTLMALANWCDGWEYLETSDRSRPAGAGNGERRSRMSYVLDTPESILENVARLCSLARAHAILQGARWRFVVDQDESPMATLTDGLDPANATVVEGSFEVGPEPGEMPTGVLVRYWSPDIDFQSKSTLAVADDVPETTPAVYRTVEARGPYREGEIARLASWALSKARKEPLLCAWESHPGRLEFEAGDVVTLNVREPGAGGSALKVRILTVSRSWGGTERLMLRFVGRVMSAQAYAVKATAESTARAAGVGNSAASAATGTGAGIPSNSGGIGSFSAAGLAYNSSLVSLSAKVLP